MTVRVVVADDHPMYRYRPGRESSSRPKAVEVVASVGDGAAAHARPWPSTRPTSSSPTSSMPDLDGVEATRRLLKAQPELPSSS